MARSHWVVRNGELVPYTPLEPSINPIIRTDEMRETWHPCDGKHYTSKTKYRATTRAYGCEEVGDDKSFTKAPERNYEPKGIKEEILKNWEKLSGR